MVGNSSYFILWGESIATKLPGTTFTCLMSEGGRGRQTFLLLARVEQRLLPQWMMIHETRRYPGRRSQE